MTSESGKRELFAGLPRRGALGGVVTGGLALLICGAFLTDVVPTRSPEDWLYALEARRDQYARAYQARERAARPERRAARAAPTPTERPTALASVLGAPRAHRPAPAAGGHEKCFEPVE